MTHRITAESAEKVWKWFQERGGIAVWKSINLADPGKTWTTPVNDAEGNPKKKPHWGSEDKPSTIITDPSQVIVDVPKEVKRFHVAVRMGSQGFTLKCTDGATRRIRREVEKMNERRAGKNDAWYEFDYNTQEAVIYVPGESRPLPEFMLVTA